MRQHMSKSHPEWWRYRYVLLAVLAFLVFGGYLYWRSIDFQNQENRLPEHQANTLWVSETEDLYLLVGSSTTFRPSPSEERRFGSVPPTATYHFSAVALYEGEYVPVEVYHLYHVLYVEQPDSRNSLLAGGFQMKGDDLLLLRSIEDRPLAEKGATVRLHRQDFHWTEEELSALPFDLDAVLAKE